MPCSLASPPLPLRPRSWPLRRARDNLFATVAFPIGMFVGVSFWGLFLVNRELIFPERFDAFIPAHVNHMLHTTVIPLQVGSVGGMKQFLRDTIDSSLVQMFYNYFFVLYNHSF